MSATPSAVAVIVIVSRTGVCRSPLGLTVRIRTIIDINITITAAVVIVVISVIALTRVLSSRIIGVGWLE